MLKISNFVYSKIGQNSEFLKQYFQSKKFEKGGVDVANASQHDLGIIIDLISHDQGFTYKNTQPYPYEYMEGKDCGFSVDLGILGMSFYFLFPRGADIPS